MKVSDDVQHKYNSMTKEKGAEYKKIFLLSMNEWNEPGQILVLAYENRNIQEPCATANIHAHPFEHYPLYKYLAYVHILTSVQRQELDFWVS